MWQYVDVPMCQLGCVGRACHSHLSSCVYSPGYFPYLVEERCFSPGNVVLHVHVTQHDMHMWSSTTCTCRTALHVHVKQRFSTSFDRFVYDIPDEPFNGTTLSILSKQCNPFQNGRVALFLLLNAL